MRNRFRRRFHLAHALALPDVLPLATVYSAHATLLRLETVSCFLRRASC